MATVAGRRVERAGLPSSGCSELTGDTVSAASRVLDQRLLATELSTAKKLLANGRNDPVPAEWWLNSPT
jgi:hypothetical protein